MQRTAITVEQFFNKHADELKLKLVAGDINRIQPPQPRYGEYGKAMAMNASVGGRGFEEKAFFEYHMYTLGRTSTIADNETKQVSLFEPANTPVKKLYRYTVADGSKDVNVVVKFKNSEANGMGMPLPAGKIRLTNDLI